ncbi:uncharacterized protein LOC143488805 [Brachyhypopomus gauderio]|uniref:uncharacterized protein LOC143484556 n=1 Tax=Brachyhypopomus gauderio TaxID=698409 RepID=UPI0040428DAD
MGGASFCQFCKRTIRKTMAEDRTVGAFPAGSHAEVLRSARHLVSLLASCESQGTTVSAVLPSREDNSRQQGGQRPGEQAPRPTVQTEMTRAFPGLYSKGKAKRRLICGRFQEAVPRKKIQKISVTFHLLPSLYEKTPIDSEQLVHLQAGLGRRTATLDEDTTHEELMEQLNLLYPKLKTIKGGWLLYKAPGGWGRRKLSLVPPEDCGYTGKILRAACKGPIYIAPLQEQLDTNPLPPTSETFSNMTKALCQKCKTLYPLQVLADHIKSCEITAVEDSVEESDHLDSDGNEPKGTKSPVDHTCPICLKTFPYETIEIHASSCGESADSHSEVADEVLPGCSAKIVDEWQSIPDPIKAMSLYRETQLRNHATQAPLSLYMDMRSTPAERDGALISFYKKTRVEWARPLYCKLEGDCAVGEGVTRFFFSTCIDRLKSGFSVNLANIGVTRLFEGEVDHLVPSASPFLVDSDLFVVAGRILGHSFIHGGPCLSGLSPAFVHVLLGGNPETATVQLNDCPDLDIRETVKLLEKSELSNEEKNTVQDLAYAWDLPGVTNDNRRWLFEKMLIHAVIGRIMRQIKQMRRGLKETPMWSVLSQRPDTVPLLFPRESLQCVPELVLQTVCWPEQEEDDSDSEYPLATKCRISGFLRHFIQTASPTEIKSLLKFWTGWEVLPRELTFEIVKGSLPTASTCFEVLKIPGHYEDFEAFRSDLLSCIGTHHTGFGLI